jgi:hypothetical protein
MLYLLASKNKCILAREGVFSFDLADPVATGALRGGKLSRGRGRELPAEFEESLGLAGHDVDFQSIV